MSFALSAGEGSSNAEGAAGSAVVAAGGEGGSGSDRDANPLEPFLGMDDGNRRLHGKKREMVFLEPLPCSVEPLRPRSQTYCTCIIVKLALINNTRPLYG